MRNRKEIKQVKVEVEKKATICFSLIFVSVFSSTFVLVLTLLNLTGVKVSR